MNEAEFVNLKGYIKSMWPSQTASWQTAVWQTGQVELAGIDAGQVYIAVRQHAHEGEPFPPTWGQIIARCGGAAGSSALPISEAWFEIQDTMRATERKARWSHPGVAVLVHWRCGSSDLRSGFGEGPDESMPGYGPWMHRLTKEYEEAVEYATTHEIPDDWMDVHPSVAQLTRQSFAAIDSGDYETFERIQRRIALALKAPPPDIGRSDDGLEQIGPGDLS